jgi:hypothetical protein
MVQPPAAALALGGEELDPLEGPVVGAVVAAVLDMVPDAERDAEKLFPYGLGVVDGVLLAAEFHPPIAEAEGPMLDLEAAVLVEGELLCGVIAIGPRGRLEGLRAVVLPRLDEAGHAHRAFVCNLGCDGLAVLAASLAAHAEGVAGEGGEDGVAGAVGEDLRLDGVVGVSGELPARDALDDIARHRGVETGAVEKECEVGLVLDLLV